jgi:hypothetical protein
VEGKLWRGEPAQRSHQLLARLLGAGLINRLDPTTKMIADGVAEALRDQPVVEEARQFAGSFEANDEVKTGRRMLL